jgi:hypothetical protein
MYLKQYMYIFFILQELLTKHKMLSSEFLENNYDKIFDNYQMLLNSENYVTRRQALKVIRIYYYLIYWYLFVNYGW